MEKILESFVEYFSRMFLEKKDDSNKIAEENKIKEKYTLTSIFPSKAIMEEVEKYIL